MSVQVKKPGIQLPSAGEAAGSMSCSISIIGRRDCFGTAPTRSTSRGRTSSAIRAGRTSRSNFQLKFPASQAVYDDLTVTVDDKPVPVRSDSSGVTARCRSSPDRRLAVGSFRIARRDMESWVYKFGDEVSQVRDFALNMKTNFKEVDFPPDTLSPTEKSETAEGWGLTWKYTNLLSGFQIGAPCRKSCSPGRWPDRSASSLRCRLFFFFFLMFIITTLAWD